MAWLAVGQVALFGSQLRITAGKAAEALAGLVELLLLQQRKIHRHVAAKGHGHRLDYVHQRGLGTAAGGDGQGAFDHRMAFIGQVDGDQDVLVGHLRFLHFNGHAFSMAWLLHNTGCRCE
jgi:hypothetical protein